MAMLATTRHTLLDLAKMMNPDGSLSAVAELLHQSNGVLQDIPYFKGNLTTGHRTSIRTGLPSVAWRLINQGTQASKSTGAQVDFSCAMLDAWSHCDVELAKLSGDVNGYRVKESKSFMEAMAQEKAQTLFYGNETTAPEEFTGLANFYSSLSAANAENIVDAGGTGSDNSSIWIVGWGEDKVYGIYPKDTEAGLEHQDKGIQTLQNANGVTGQFMDVYMDHFIWRCGLAVADWRYAVRVCNIDISLLIAGTGADLVDQLISAYHRLYSMDGISPVIYMNRTVFQEFDRQGRADVQAGGQLGYAEVDGLQRRTFRGIPVRITDALTEAEARVT